MVFAALALGCRPPPLAVSDVAGADRGPGDEVACVPVTHLSSPTLAPERIQQALNDRIGYPVEQLAAASMRAKPDEYRNFVAFKASGPSYCRATRSDADAAECVFHPGDLDSPWEVDERLGFAVIAFSDQRPPVVERHRIAPVSKPLWDGSPNWEHPSEHTEQHQPKRAYENEVFVNRVDAGDVDGDCEDEYVVHVRSQRVSPQNDFDEVDTTSADQTYINSHVQTRLLIVREDLSLQFDAYIEAWYFNGPASYADIDVVHPHYEFLKPSADAPAALVVSACEISSQVAEGCALATVCADPTRVDVVLYQPDSDSFSTVERHRVRPVISECAERLCDHCTD